MIKGRLADYSKKYYYVKYDVIYRKYDNKMIDILANYCEY